MKDGVLPLRVSVGGGRTTVVDIPADRLLPTPRRPPATPLADSAAAIREAVEDMLGCPGLRDRLVLPGARVCIVVPDKTRQMPVSLALGVLMSELRELGVGADQTFVVLATGTHPPMTQEEIERHVGSGIALQLDVRNHNFRDPRKLVPIGDDLELMGRRLPVVVNRDVYEADVTLAIGSVRPHRAVGWSGGAKIILPGVSGEETIELWHWLGWKFPREAIYWQIENPMRDIMESIAARVGLDAVVNFVMNRDGEPFGVFGGHFIDAQRRAAALAIPNYTVPVEEKADILLLGSSLVSTSMYPAAAQLQKAPQLVKQGGTVILLADCPDGVAPGLPQIREFGYHPPQEVGRLVESGRLTSLVAASHIMYVSEGLFGAELDCILVAAGLDANDAKRLGFAYADSPQEALACAQARHGAESRIRVITHLPQDTGSD